MEAIYIYMLLARSCQCCLAYATYAHSPPPSLLHISPYVAICHKCCYATYVVICYRLHISYVDIWSP